MTGEQAREALAALEARGVSSAKAVVANNAIEVDAGRFAVRMLSASNRWVAALYHQGHHLLQVEGPTASAALFALRDQVFPLWNVLLENRK